jgi:hypothetical protein
MVSGTLAPDRWSLSIARPYRRAATSIDRPSSGLCGESLASMTEGLTRTTLKWRKERGFFLFVISKERSVRREKHPERQFPKEIPARHDEP